MKTIEEIKNEEAKKIGFESWNNALMEVDDRCTTTQFIEITDRAIKSYAKQCCDEQIKACGSRWLNTPDEDSYSPYAIIISTPNVAKKP